MFKEEADWELSEEYYGGNGEEKKLSLEDFISESDAREEGFGTGSPSDELLKKTISDVRQVLALAQKGNSIETIASLTGLDEKYVYDIQVCAQGFREDDEIAVAHLVLG
ncbi:MAG: hypothetical protein QM657_11995 [Lacrimispora sp.]|uniref:hypothetical protein n=1 Tax=Lacrimispora sp. TaxID=2719234 RepID=UPI0039E60CF7